MSEATVDTFRTAARAVSAELREADAHRKARLAVIAWCLLWESDTGHKLDDDEAALIVDLAHGDRDVRARLNAGELEVSDLCWAALRAREAATHDPAREPEHGPSALVAIASPPAPLSAPERLAGAIAAVVEGSTVADAARAHGCLRGAIVLGLRELGRGVSRKVDTIADRIEAAAAEAEALGMHGAALKYRCEVRSVAKFLLYG